MTKAPKSALAAGLASIRYGTKPTEHTKNLSQQGRHTKFVNTDATLAAVNEAHQAEMLQERQGGAIDLANETHVKTVALDNARQREHHLTAILHGAAQEFGEAKAEWTSRQGTLDAEQHYLHFKNTALQCKNDDLMHQNESLTAALHTLSAELQTAQSANELLETSIAVLNSGRKPTIAEAAWTASWNHRAKNTIKIDDLMADLAILAALEMSVQTYNTFKPFLRLPHYDTAVKLRKEHAMYTNYTLGFNDGALQLAALLHARKGTITSTDGTRMRRDIGVIGSAALGNQGLGGRQYPPDVRNWPTRPDPIPGRVEHLDEYVKLCRGDPTLLSHDLCTVGIHSVTHNPTNFIPICLFPEPVFGFGVKHAMLLMMETALCVWRANIHCFGECTDSCSSDHGAGLQIQTPRTPLLKLFPYWIGVDVPGFRYWAPIIAIGEAPQNPADSEHSKPADSEDSEHVSDPSAPTNQSNHTNQVRKDSTREDHPKDQQHAHVHNDGGAQLLADSDKADTPKTSEKAGDIRKKLLREYIWSWYGERLHTERNVRKNLAAHTRQLLTELLPDLSRKIAVLSELKEVEAVLKKERICTKHWLTTVKDMYTIKSFRDQNSTAAHSLLMMNTMEALRRARGKHSHALLLYLIIGFYLFEPWSNPDFTEPYLVSVFLWTAKQLLDKLERHVELWDLDKNVFLLSGTTRRTLDSMCHSGQAHFLKGWRNAKQDAFDLSDNWTELSLYLVNTLFLEGYHGASRMHGNDVSKSISEWIGTVNSNVLKQAIRQALAEKYNFVTAQPKNRRKVVESHTLFQWPVPESLKELIGIAGQLLQTDLMHGTKKSPVCPAMHMGPFVEYEHLHDAMAAGCRAAVINAQVIYKALCPLAAAYLEGQPCPKYTNQFLAQKEWLGRPDNFDKHIVMCSGNPSGPMDPCGPDGIAKYLNMTANDDADVEEDDLWRDTLGGARSKDSKQKREDAVTKFKRLNELIRQVDAEDTKPVAPKKGQSQWFTTTPDGSTVSVTEFLTNTNPREWVSKDRGPRFWCGLLSDAKPLPSGHNCTVGTIIAFSFKGNADLIALGRVARLESIRTETAPKSCKLVCSQGKQDLTVEICWQVDMPAMPLPTGDLRFVASGACVSISGVDVVACPVRTQLDLLVGESSVVLASKDSTDLLSRGTFATIESLTHAYSIGPVIKRPDVDPEDRLCCRCGDDWWEESTGLVERCNGACARWFHTGCVEDIDHNDVACGTWECCRCTGEDDAICVVCDNEWFDHRRKIQVSKLDQEPEEHVNPNYTGYALQCLTCERWYHQICHEPHIPDEYVDSAATDHPGAKRKRTGNKKGRQWNCDSCTTAKKAQLQPIPPPTTAVTAKTAQHTSKKVQDAQPHAQTVGEQLRHVGPMENVVQATQPPESAWLCAKCLKTMPAEALYCLCQGCNNCTSGCGLHKRTGINVSAGRTKHKAVIPAGMVATTTMRTAEHRTNQSKIKATFKKPCASKLSVMTPQPATHRPQPCRVHIEAIDPDMLAIAMASSPWECYKCGVWMQGYQPSCTCSGCSTCVSGCGLQRHIAAPKHTRRIGVGGLR